MQRPDPQRYQNQIDDDWVSSCESLWELLTGLLLDTRTPVRRVAEVVRGLKVVRLLDFRHLHQILHPQDDMGLEDETAAYLAGLLDGEGSISIAENKKLGMILEVTIYNTYRSVLDEFRSLTGMGSMVSYPAGRVAKVPYFAWHLSSVQAARLLRAIFPYLRIKRQQATYGLALQGMKERRGVAPLTDADRKIRLELHRQLHELNRHGSVDGPISAILKSLSYPWHRQKSILFDQRLPFTSEDELKNATWDTIQEIKGVGPKLAALWMWIVHDDTTIPIIDTHVKRWIREQGYEGNVISSVERADYMELAEIVREEARDRGMTLRDLDRLIVENGQARHQGRLRDIRPVPPKLCHCGRPLGGHAMDCPRYAQ